MKVRKSFGDRTVDLFLHLFLMLFSFVCIYPLYYCLMASVSDSDSFYLHKGLLLLPLGFSTKAYELVAQNPFIVKGFLYSAFIVITGTTLNLILTSFGAYVLSRKRVYWKKLMMFIILITMYFSGGIIPSYIINTQYLHLQDTPWALILPHAINTFNLILMRTYFSSISDSMEESAKMDGANDFTVLFKIILPLAFPVVAVMIIYYGVSHWNGWFSAMIYLQKSDGWKPLQLVLRDVLITDNTQTMMDLGDTVSAERTRRLVKYALITVTTMPIIFIYPFMQKYFIGGAMIGSLKE